MKKLFKYLLLGIVAVTVITALGIAYIALTFDPNAYKPQLVKAVKDSTQRTLTLDGDIRLSFYPSIGANLNGVALSEYRSDKEFASVKAMHVSLALFPLLRKEVIVDEISLNGAKISLSADQEGKTNYDDLLNKDKSPAPAENDAATSPIRFDIASITVENASFDYLDQRNGTQLSVSELTLHTGRLTNNVPSKVDLSVRLRSASMKADVTALIKTDITFDLDAQHYQLHDLDVRVSGRALEFSNLGLGINGDIDALLANRKVSATRLALKTSFDAPFGKLESTVSVPSAVLDEQTLSIPDLTAEANLKQAAQNFALSLNAAVTGDMKLQQFGLVNMRFGVAATGEKLPNKKVSSEMQGSVTLDMLKQSARVSVAGGLLQSQITARASLANFSNPAISFDVALDQLDADLYLPGQTAPSATSDAQKPEQPIDLTALRTLSIDGRLRIGKLKAFEVKVQELQVDVEAKDGIVQVAPVSASLYNGSLVSSIVVDAAKPEPRFSANAKLQSIEIGPLLVDALKMDFLSGKGNVALNVATQGNLAKLLKSNLNGKMSVNLSDGAVKGINLAKSIRDFRSGGDKTQTASNVERTDFSEMNASFRITDGVAHNDDLSLKSPFIRVAGNGDINIGQDSLDYLVKATVTGNIEGQGGKDDVTGLTVPVRLSGPYTQLRYKLEFGSMLSDQAKQKAVAAAAAAKQKAAAAADEAKQKAQQAVDDKKQQAKDKIQDQLQQGLKGLFR